MVLKVFQRQGRSFYVLLLLFLNLEDIPQIRNMTSKLTLEPVVPHPISDDFPEQYEAVGNLLEGAPLPENHRSELLISYSRSLPSQKFGKIWKMGHIYAQCRAGTTTCLHSKCALSPAWGLHHFGTRTLPSPERCC